MRANSTKALRFGARGLILLGAGMLAASALLTGFHLREQRRAGEISARLLQLAEEQVSGNRTPLGETPPAAGEKAGENHAFSEESLAALEVEGILSIPALGLRLPVLADFNEELLSLSVCVYERDGGGQGRLIIAGHNYRSHFGSLSGLKPGDAVSFTPLGGSEQAYQVTELLEVPADGRDQLEAGDWDLTLFTCNLDMSRRIVVRLTLSEGAAEI